MKPLPHKNAQELHQYCTMHHCHDSTCDYYLECKEFGHRNNNKFEDFFKFLYSKTLKAKLAKLLS